MGGDARSWEGRRSGRERERKWDEVLFLRWAIVTLFFALCTLHVGCSKQIDGRGARRVCDSSDDDGARRQSGNTSGDRLLSGDERVSASLGAARQSAMVGSGATRLFCGGDALFSVSCSRKRSEAQGRP